MSMRNRRSALRLRPVKSLKHIVDTQGALIAAAQSVTDVINTVTSPDLATANQVAEGSTINAIYLRVEVASVVAAGGVDNIYMIVFKSPGNNITPPGNLDSVGISDKKRFVLHQEMLMTGQNGSNPGAANIPRTLFKGVVVLPRTFKRFGYDDKLQVILQHRAGEATQRTDFCIECIYKEFR